MNLKVHSLTDTFLKSYLSHQIIITTIIIGSTALVRALAASQLRFRNVIDA
jgi:hypothetical protein